MKGDALPQRSSDLMTLDEAADYLRVNRQTLRDWVWRKRLIPYYSIGATGRRGKPMVRKADLDKFVESRLVPAIEVVDGEPRER